MTISVVVGDITQQHVDVIVNAANRALRGGDGVDGAIHAAAGPTVLEKLIRTYPEGIRTGELNADFILHAAGPNHAASETSPDLLLRRCYAQALDFAAHTMTDSIAFPLISAGIYGWPLADAIDIAVTELEHAPAALDVRIVVLDEKIAELVRERIARGGNGAQVRNRAATAR